MATIQIFNDKDTYYGTAYSTDGKPDSETLNMGGWGDYYYSHMEWDLTGSPSSAVTNSCLIYLFSENDAKNDPAASIRRITSSWTEVGVTLASHPTDTSTGQVSITPNPWTSIQWWNYTVTTMYTDWKDGTYPNYGFKLNPTANGETNGHYSSSDDVDSGRHPYLFVDYNEVATSGAFFGLM